MGALFTYFFADVDMLMVTPLLTNAETAAVGANPADGPARPGEESEGSRA